MISLDEVPAGITALGALASRLDFAALISQRGRMMQLQTALPELALVPERLVMREALNQPFELVLDALSSSRYLELKRLIGEQMTLSLLGSDGAYPPWHGYVFEAAQLGADGGLARYRLVMRPWLAFLELRRDSCVYQDKTALEIVEDLFKDYPQAQYELRVSESLRQRSLCVQYRESDLAFVQRLLAEEGLSYHFEHLDEQAAAQADDAGRARHKMVITDRSAERADLGPARFTTQHETALAAGQRDAITAFMARRRAGATAVTLGAWDYRQLAGTTAQETTALDNGELPTLEHYDGAGAYRYQDAEHAQRAAELALQALELDYKQYEGQGSTRHFSAGARFALIDHPLYGANTSAFDDPGALGASRERPDNQFILLAVEHQATNNLGANAAELMQSTELERGSYKNHFHAAPAAAAIVPKALRKPTAPGLQTALVVGQDQAAINTEREQRVKIQFPWQRGERPLAGGLVIDDDNNSASPGNAPGDERSGTWVRVAQASAGANWGSAYVPRIGTEVAVQYIEGDIDRPLIVGQSHNGQDLPPYSAGEDSGVNHPGVISGVHSQSLDAGDYNQWVVDDATGQLRMRLLCSYSAAQVGLGHLIRQDQGAQRGAWRGAGIEAHTQGWASLRAAQGLLVSTSARTGSYGSAQGTQMDAAEALAQLNAARELGQRLSDAAQASGAMALNSHGDGKALAQFTQAMDPKQDGKHPATVNGQSALKPGPDGRADGTDPVETFARPQIVLDTPSTQAWTTEASLMSLAGQSTSLTSQGDIHQAAAHTYAQVSGQTTSLYTHQGGAKVIAANGPVSLRAHTDQLQIWADKDVTVISVNDEIRIQAHSKIELIGGQSAMVLEGGNVSFSCPGKFEVKAGTHAFMDGGSGAAALPVLPDGRAKIYHEQFQARNSISGNPVEGMPYRIELADGSVITGRTGKDSKTEVVATSDPQGLKLFWLPASAGDIEPGQGAEEGC